jgi:chromosome segregation ATPase
MDLRGVLSEFESSPLVKIDDLFVNERSRILSNIELELQQIRRERFSREETIRILSKNRLLLEQVEEEYATKTKEIDRQKNSEIKRISSNIKSLKEEQNRLARTKTGIFRAMSKKAKEQKETEVTQTLNSKQRELEMASQHFAAEQERLRDEYERRKRPIIDQIRDQQKEVEKQEIDWSLEARKATCDTLANEVNALIQRKGSQPN